MTYKENVRAILETNFSGFKDNLIDAAVERICELTMTLAIYTKDDMTNEYLKGYNACKDIIKPTGEWIDTGDMQEYWAEEYQCSLCGAKDHWHNYCPNCGAKMKGEEE